MTWRINYASIHLGTHYKIFYKNEKLFKMGQKTTSSCSVYTEEDLKTSMVYRWRLDHRTGISDLTIPIINILVGDIDNQSFGSKQYYSVNKKSNIQCYEKGKQITYSNCEKIFFYYQEKYGFSMKGYKTIRKNLFIPDKNIWKVRHYILHIHLFSWQSHVWYRR